MKKLEKARRDKRLGLSLIYDGLLLSLGLSHYLTEGRMGYRVP